MKFRFVDRIIAWEPRTRIAGDKAVSFEEYMLKSRFGGPECLPESLLAQAVIGLADWLVLLSTDFRQRLTPDEIEQCIFHQILRPGKRVRMQVECREWSGDRVWFAARGTVDDEPLVTVAGVGGRLTSAVEDLDIDDTRTLFSELFQPLNS
jgi:3-hydroxymyristoyl/3-hydroxydecanoyl-(acyl carrier protein) dehydratase